MLNGRRVYVRQLELAPIAVDGEASKKMVSIIFYGNHNYHSEDVFVFSIVLSGLFLVAAALLIADIVKHTKKLNKAIKKLRGMDNDRN